MAQAWTTAGPAGADLPVIRRIGFADLRAALAAGARDFLATPTQLVFLCVLYPVIGLLAARALGGGGLLHLLFPLVAGLSLLGPVAAVGLYEISRRREAGLPASWRNAFDVTHNPAFPSILGVGVLLTGLFLAWLLAARLLYAATIGVAPGSAWEFLEFVLRTEQGHRLILLGNLVGFGFAAAVLALTVVSVPMLLDRNCSLGVAIATSLRACLGNPVPMAAWGLIVAAALLIGSLPAFIGLAVAMPVLGHATWHLYRRVVG